MFSFNNPYGACPACTGLGSQLKVDPELIIPNKDLVHSGGGHHRLRLEQHQVRRHCPDVLRRPGQKYRFKLDTPVKDLSPR